jgi:hypothetical protein
VPLPEAGAIVLRVEYDWIGRYTPVQAPFLDLDIIWGIWLVYSHMRYMFAYSNITLSAYGKTPRESPPETAGSAIGEVVTKPQPILQGGIK